MTNVFYSGLRLLVVSKPYALSNDGILRDRHTLCPILSGMGLLRIPVLCGLHVNAILGLHVA